MEVFFIMLILFFVLIVANANITKQILPPSVKACPPHAWKTITTIDSNGNKSGGHMVCDSCGKPPLSFSTDD